MNNKNKKLLNTANKCLKEKDFANALKFFSILYKENPKNLDAKVGVLLCSVSKELYDEVLPLFDFYNIAKDVDNKNSYTILESLVESLEIGLVKNISQTNEEFEKALENEDGILFDDFKKLYQKNENPKKLLENIFFSTKVIITQKKDFFEFINILIKNDYIDMALNYLDSASAVFPADEKIRELLKKIKAHQL